MVYLLDVVFIAWLQGSYHVSAAYPLLASFLLLLSRGISGFRPLLYRFFSHLTCGLGLPLENLCRCISQHFQFPTYFFQILPLSSTSFHVSLTPLNWSLLITTTTHQNIETSTSLIHHLINKLTYGYSRFINYRIIYSNENQPFSYCSHSKNSIDTCVWRWSTGFMRHWQYVRHCSMWSICTNTFNFFKLH